MLSLMGDCMGVILECCCLLMRSLGQSMELCLGSSQLQSIAKPRLNFAVLVMPWLLA